MVTFNEHQLWNLAPIIYSGCDGFLQAVSCFGGRDQAGTRRQHAAVAVLQAGPVPARITPSLPIAIALIRP